MPTAIKSVALLIAGAILLGFVWLLLHNQSQTEYLIFFDFWRNYNVLAGHGRVDEYLFHDVHTYVVASLFWYLDVWLSGGSLKLFHGVVLGANVAVFGCLVFLSIRLFQFTTIHRIHAVAIATTAMSLWLSPSNSVGLTYPVADILATVLVLTVSLSAILLDSSSDMPTNTVGRRLRQGGYLGVAVFGFFAFETFIAVPLFFALDSVLRKRYRDALPHLMIVFLLLALYVALRERPILAAAATEAHRDYVAFAHNSLMFLSMHVVMVLRALEIRPGLASSLAVLSSVIQLTAVALFAVSHYWGSPRGDLAPRFALAFVAVGIVSIGLAVWLRFSSDVINDPVSRYTPYSILLTMGVLFLAVRAIATNSGRALRLASVLAVGVIVLYLLADVFAFLQRSDNPGSTFAQSRLEMAVYASSPGSEMDLGPSDPDGGLALRSNLHAFLSARGVSVFGSAGYLGLGGALPPSEASGMADCLFVREQAAPGERPGYRLATFRIAGMSGNGVFLLVDQDGVIEAFGFAAKLHPADETVGTLLPAGGENASRVLYAQVRGQDLVTAVPCR